MYYEYMSSIERVAIVVDGGSSARKSPQFPEVMEGRVEVMSLDLQFTEGGKPETYPGSDISDEEFYRRMGSSKVLPQTSGAIRGRATETYRRLALEADNIVSIHITSEHSASFGSGVKAAEDVEESVPGLRIRVIDSRNLSIATWFLAEQAAVMALEGATPWDIERVTLETIPKLETDVMLETLDNIVKGGRLSPSEGWLGNVLKFRPIIGVIDGKIQKVSRPRSTKAAMQELVSQVEKREGEIVKLAVVHANNPQGAENLADLASNFFPRERIRIYEAGPVIGVHTGEGALGLVAQRAQGK